MKKNVKGEPLKRRTGGTVVSSFPMLGVITFEEKDYPMNEAGMEALALAMSDYVPEGATDELASEIFNKILRST